MSSFGALYVHVPFCARKCLYCDFHSKACPAADPCMERFVSDLVRHIDLFSKQGLLEGCTTAYVGGGTPSFLGERPLAILLEAIRTACPQVEELSFEANPDSLTNAMLERARNAGATRVSMGIQSLEDDELRALGRIHTAAQALDCLKAAASAGLDVSADLMCAIPLQTDETWTTTLERVCATGVGHVSVYPLAIEEGTPFEELYGENAPFNDEQVQAERMEKAAEVLEAAGFCRYEVASYARDGLICRHNVAYWTGVSYLGLGAGASSMMDAGQYCCLRSLQPQLPPLPSDVTRVRLSVGENRVDYEFLNERQAWAEDLMLGMRLVRGVREDEVPRDVTRALRERGLVVERDGRLAPTHDGWLLGNELYGALWDLAEGRVVHGGFTIGSTQLWRI